MKIFEKVPTLFVGQQVILADLSSNVLHLTKWHSIGFSLELSCPFSSSKAPWSNVMNSFGTPCGLHYICEKIGYHVPVGGEFVARKFTGLVIPQARSMKEKARILTRILRLKGCQWGINLGFDARNRCCDTYARCVYIHGTNFEKFIPQSLSCGCLLLKTEDLVQLFDRVFVGAFCLIRK